MGEISYGSQESFSQEECYADASWRIEDGEMVTVDEFSRLVSGRAALSPLLPVWPRWEAAATNRHRHLRHQGSCVMAKSSSQLLYPAHLRTTTIVGQAAIRPGSTRVKLVAKWLRFVITAVEKWGSNERHISKG
jgi:hypothetical protein